MEHFAPHRSAGFEGYYNKFVLPSGASLIVIICSVPRAATRPHMVSISYVGADVTQAFRKELWVDRIEPATAPDHSFVLTIPGVGYFRALDASTTECDLRHADFAFHARTTTRVPWSRARDTPEGALVRLPLPLHWHVHSLRSECAFTLRIPSVALPPEDGAGRAVAHQEKNWARSFPTAHVWLQACHRAADDDDDGDNDEDPSAICLAGGRILGMEAFLAGYRGRRGCSVDFRPPFALRLLGLSPFMTTEVDWPARRVRLSLQSFRQKLVVTAVAPPGSFVGLSAPFREGHRANALGQSYQATVGVELYESGWWGPWRLVETARFEGAALEFGGDYYGPQLSERWVN